MRKPNKQDLIFTGIVLLYIAVTFIAYSLIRQHILMNGCHAFDGILHLSPSTSLDKCFSYLSFFRKSSNYFYLLFLCVTITPFVKREYFSSYNGNFTIIDALSIHRLNKQDFIFIGKVLLFIVSTFTIYLIVRIYFVDTCVLPSEKGYIGYALNVRHTEMCFGSGGFFDTYSHYFYILFLWIIVVLSMRKKYQFSNNKLFTIGIVTLIGSTGTVLGLLFLFYNI